MQQHIEAGLDDDTLDWGAAAIGRVITRTERQTYHLLQTGALPARKIGEQWVASRKRLRAAIVGEAE